MTGSTGIITEYLYHRFLTALIEKSTPCKFIDSLSIVLNREMTSHVQLGFDRDFSSGAKLKIPLNLAAFSSCLILISI